MAAKNGLNQPAIGKLDGGGLKGVIHRGNYVPAAGEILKEESVVGEGSGITVREDDDRMCPVGDGSVPATVGGDMRERDSHQTGKITPHTRRDVVRALAVLTGRCGIPEAHQELSRSDVTEERISARGVHEIHHLRADDVGAGGTRGSWGGVFGYRDSRESGELAPSSQGHLLRAVGTAVADGKRGAIPNGGGRPESHDKGARDAWGHAEATVVGA